MELLQNYRSEKICRLLSSQLQSPQIVRKFVDIRKADTNSCEHIKGGWGHYSHSTSNIFSCICKICKSMWHGKESVKNKSYTLKQGHVRFPALDTLHFLERQVMIFLHNQPIYAIYSYGINWCICL